MSCVTILMPVYNAMPFLPKAVESILCQTLQDISILIVNDGSTDESFTYLSQINDPRIRIINLAHQGQGAALNIGLEECKTEFLARMDSDDISLPNRFAEQLAFMRKNTQIAAVGTQFKYIGSKGVAPSPRLPLYHDVIRAYLLRAQLSIVHASIMFRTSALREIGGYRIKGSGQDWDLFLRLSETSELANLPQTHYLWRLHKANSVLRRLIEAKIGIDYGCYCSELRMQGIPELAFEEYYRQETQKLWQRLRRFSDVFALSQYRKGLAEIGDGQPFRGYARLALSVLCSPPRTAARAGRMLRSIIRPHQKKNIVSQDVKV